jgi:HPr kinase/phosphorylase
MRELPGKFSDKGRSFSVGDFYEEACEKLQLTIIEGEDCVDRIIEEPMVSRPGLALTGFFGHYAWKRIQLIGKAETAYLENLDKTERLSRLRSLLEHGAYFFIFANNRKLEKETLELMREYRAVVMISPLKTRNIYRESAFVLERLGAPEMTMYGTMVEVSGTGVLLEGDPGLGKSETALGLIRRGCALVADDLTCIRREIGTDVLFGSASDSTAGYMEIRGIGIMHIASLFGAAAVRGEKRLELIITFRRLSEVEGEIDRVGQARRVKKILGVDVPNIIVPVSAGRDLVNLVETAVLQQKLLFAGMDPVNDLSERLRLRAEKNKKLNKR